MFFKTISLQVFLVFLTNLQFNEAISCNGVITFGDRCCGTTGYYAGSNMCRDDVIANGDSCCGKQGYNAGFNICCSDVIKTGQRC